MKKYYALVCAFVLSITYLCTAEMYLGINGFLSIPTGDFQDDDDLRTNGLATYGPGLMVEFNYPIYKDNLSLTVSGAYLIHFFSKEKAEDERILRFTDDLEGGTYFLLPIVLGPRFTYPLKKFELFGQVQSGIEFLSQKDLEGETTLLIRLPWEAEFENSMTWTVTFTGGIAFSSGLYLGARYQLTGEHEYDYTETNSNTQDTREFATNMIHLFLGYQFGF